MNCMCMSCRGSKGSTTTYRALHDDNSSCSDHHVDGLSDGNDIALDASFSSKENYVCIRSEETMEEQKHHEHMTGNGKCDSATLSLVTSCNDKDNPTQYKTDVVYAKPKDADEMKRETWGKNFEFLLSVIGFAVDLGNVWRFPYICYDNGGGAFLIPYGIMYVFGGLPLFYLELALGQYQRVGCISVWRRICPLFQGIGYGICIISFYLSIYYNTVIAWALYYFFASWKKQVPWKGCGNPWNTGHCQEFEVAYKSNRTDDRSGAQEYFNYEVLEIQKSDGLNSLGYVKWSIALCLLAVFVIVYFSLWKGIKSSGKAVWFTAIFPYIVLLILLVRGVTLPGAMLGIKYYLTPKWNKLHEPSVWIAAAGQVYFSLGPGFGVLLALSSYNKFHNNCYRDALITSSINCLTSLLAGFVVFSGIGFMATKLKKHVQDVATEGPGLVFEVYPEVIAQLPGSPFFAVMFFLMLITLGLDSTFGGLEALITGVLDEFKVLRKRREIFVACLLSTCFVTSLATTTYGGKYLVQLLDKFAAPISILFIVFLEAIAVSWFYGFNRFSEDIKAMLGFQPGYFWKACWAVVSPLFLWALFCLSIWEESTKDKLIIGDYEYPKWAQYVGWVIVSSSIICVPICAIYKIASAEGTFRQRVTICLSPEEEPDIPDECLTNSTECTEAAKV